MQKTIDSPLGGCAHLYLEKSSSGGAILLNPNEETLEFYPSGYTKVSPRNNRPRQDTLRQIYETAVSLGTEQGNYPFSDIPHCVTLFRDHLNTKDKYATHVLLGADISGSKLSHLDGHDIGWVPERISKVIAKNITEINSGRILRVRANFHKKYFTCKVIFGYGDTYKEPVELTLSSRFHDIAGEL